MKLTPLHWLLGGVAVLAGVAFLASSSTPTARDGDAPAKNERDRLAQLGQQLLTQVETNPGSVSPAQLRAVAVQLRTVQEPGLADLLDGAATRMGG